VITGTLDNMPAVARSVGDALTEAIEEDARTLMADATAAVVAANYRVTGETAGSWSAYVDGSGEVSRRSEGVHEPQTREEAAAIFSSWRLDRAMGFASNHPAMVRLASGSSKKMKPGWVENQLKSTARKARGGVA